MSLKSANWKLTSLTLWPHLIRSFCQLMLLPDTDKILISFTHKSLPPKQLTSHNPEHARPTAGASAFLSICIPHCVCLFFCNPFFTYECKDKHSLLANYPNATVSFPKSGYWEERTIRFALLLSFLMSSVNLLHHLGSPSYIGSYMSGDVMRRKAVVKS